MAAAHPGRDPAGKGELMPEQMTLAPPGPAFRRPPRSGRPGRCGHVSGMTGDKHGRTGEDEQRSRGNGVPEFR